MENETSQVNVDHSKLLCRVVDVEASIGKSLQRFVEEKKSSLDDLVDLMRVELSKIELFNPSSDDTTI